MARINFTLTINGINRSSLLLEASHSLTLNEVGRLRVVLTSGTGINLNQTISLVISDTSVVPTWNTGTYYIDSFQEYDDSFVIDATNINNTVLSQDTVTFTDQNLNSICNSLTSKLGLAGTNFAVGTGFRAGLAVSGIAQCIISDSNEWKAIIKAAKLYGYGYFIHNNIGYLVDTAIAATTTLTRNNTVRIIDTSSNSIDAIRTISAIRYKSNNTLPNRTVTDVLWGRTENLTGEGFHETITAASRRAIGLSVEKNSQRLSFRTDAIAGANWLPGQAYNLSSAEFNPLFAKSYFVYKLTHRLDGFNGWSTQLDLRQTPALT